MIDIQNCSVSIAETSILHSISLLIESGKVHAIMGPNGSGKSTLAYALMGHPEYALREGSILFNTKDITQTPIDERARLGICMTYQQPQEIPGVEVFTFLYESFRACVNKEIQIPDFFKYIEETADTLGIDKDLLARNVNEGFSGGQKKQLELLTLAVLQPNLVIMDEIDSGLDIDSIKIIHRTVELLKKNNPNVSFLIITHYTRLLETIRPDYVHILKNGKIVKSGSFTLAQDIELYGYDAF